VYDYVGA